MNTTPYKLKYSSKYSSPTIERINLDNEISLILVSGTPGNPGGSNNMNPANQFAAPEYFNQHPVKDIVG